jgi:glycerophosphoryl diester phosphodiesterase
VIQTANTLERIVAVLASLMGTSYARKGFFARGEVPEAKIIYLDHQLVLSAAAAGHDLVAACHAAGKRVDAYTINTADARGMDLIRRLVSLKVDQITTDDPEGVAARWGT